MKRILTVLFLGLALAGCESDFQKCINTELPGAENTLGLAAAQEEFKELNLLRARIELSAERMIAPVEWNKSNPEPEGLPIGSGQVEYRLIGKNF